MGIGVLSRQPSTGAKRYKSTTSKHNRHPETQVTNLIVKDYYASHYIAEMVNSFTNLQFVYLGIKGIRTGIKNGDDPVFIVAWSAYTLLGLGSFAFHATLRYSMQLVDELAMIYTTSILLHAAFSYGKSKVFQICLGTFIATLSISVTFYYHYLQDPVFHQVLFATMTIGVVARNRYITETTLRPSKRKTSPDQGVKTRRGEEEQARKDARDLILLKRTYAVVRTGLASVLFGFFIWNLDNIFCSLWKRWRYQLGLPWGIILEGHGWWHIFTGLSGYISVLWSSWNRRCLQGRQDEYELVWPTWFTIPTVVHHQPESTPGQANRKKNN